MHMDGDGFQEFHASQAYRREIVYIHLLEEKLLKFYTDPVDT